MRVVALPPTPFLEKVLAGLLVREVETRDAPGAAPSGPIAVAHYRTDAPVLEVVALCELPLAAALAAALTVVPPRVAAEAVAARALDASLRENLGEVMNVLARFVSGSGRRFVLAGTRCPPEEAPELVSAARASDEVRGFAVRVHGYLDGALTFHTL